MDQPVPFQIFDSPGGGQVATNGALRLVTLAGEGAQMRLRRAVKGISTKPPAERLIPELNRLAGEFLAEPGMPAEQVLQRLLVLQGLVPVAKPQNVEWAYAELDGVRVYADGVHVIVTRQDLTP